MVVLRTETNRFIEGITEARMAEVVGMVGGGGLGEWGGVGGLGGPSFVSHSHPHILRKQFLLEPQDPWRR